MSKYNTCTLSSGLRVIHLPADSHIIYCGYQIAAGTRDEQPGEEGLAHFCEHATFKGTRRRTSIQIMNALENVGGDLNAFTNKESTVYYAALMHEHFPKAVDLLSDMVFNSTYPQAELEKEKEVICDEIESYNDSPAELIYDDFENILFEGHPLGHNILGTAERVRSFTTTDALCFARRYYRPDNSIFFVYGDIDFKRLCSQLTKIVVPAEGEKPVKPSVLATDTVIGRNIVIDKQTHQAHVMVGTRAYNIHDHRRMPFYLLNNMLGGPAMSSRLNLALRERHGLVYTVDSTMVSYGDTGMWAIYFGCDAKDVNRCLRLVRRELDRFMQHELNDSQLRRAKQQLKGQIALACDNRENFAIDFGKSFLHYGWEKDITSLYEHIDAITAKEIMEVANDLFQRDKLTKIIYKS